MILICVFTVLCQHQACHMIMSFPPPRGYKGNAFYTNVDYDLMAPMKTPVFCKGKPPGPAVQTVRGKGKTYDSNIPKLTNISGRNYKCSI
jgi:hypothetical protein